MAQLALLLTAFALAVASASAQFQITLTPSTTPWPADNATQVYAGASTVAELSTSKTYFGPCTYRMLHIHFSGDELLTVITGQLTSTLIAPNNTVYTHDLMAGDNVVYPRGWLHLQYNPTCTQTYALVAFNARSVGTVNIPSNMANAGNEYLRAAYGRRFPDPVGLWVTNAACAKACAAAGRRLA